MCESEKKIVICLRLTLTSFFTHLYLRQSLTKTFTIYKNTSRNFRNKIAINMLNQLKSTYTATFKLQMKMKVIGDQRIIKKTLKYTDDQRLKRDNY